MSAFEIAAGVWSALIFFGVVMASIDNLKSGNEMSEGGRVAGLVSFYGLIWFIARLMGAA